MKCAFKDEARHRRIAVYIYGEIYLSPTYEVVLGAYRLDGRLNVHGDARLIMWVADFPSFV
jgi:hypothetical protein